MTAIYERLNATGYEIVNTVNGYDDDEVLRNLYGPSRKHDWKPILVQRDRPTRRGAFKAADLPHSGGELILRPSAVDALQDILDAHGEVLPLATEDGVKLFVFNPRFVIDAIDKERSIYEQYPEAGLILMNKYVFIEEMIRDIDIFYQSFGQGQICFSDRFVERVKKANLKGTEFIRLWSNDGSPTVTKWMKSP
jgi:hypothetical protein